MELKQTVPKLEEIIISLIENDIINTRLLNGLRDLSLKPLDYTLSLYKIVFWHIGFLENEITEELTDWYFNQTEKVSMLKEPVTKDDYKSLARIIYNELKAKIQLPNYG